jgi:ABC-type transport system involved in cytochrome c biogenesis permease component
LEATNLFDSVIKQMVMAPRTSILGAILLTGYLGGAVATHVRVGSPLLTHVLFPLYIAVLLWGGLYLRDERVRALIAPRS